MMKKTYFVLIAFFVLFTVYLWANKLGLLIEKNPSTTERKLSPEILDVMGASISEEQQAFEDFVKSLFVLAPNDEFNSGWGIKKINLEERRKFFTNKSWEQYKNYVSYRKKLFVTNAENSIHSSASFIRGTQSYEGLPSKGAAFRSKGHYIVSHYDAGGSEGNFTITLKFTSSNFKAAQGVMISDWNVIDQ